MPSYTEEQKRNALIAAGYDPEKYEGDDEGNVYERIKGISPSTSFDSDIPNKPVPRPSVAPTQANYTPLQTAGLVLAESAPSAVGSALGGAGGLALGGALAPPTGGLSLLIPFLGMLAGGIGGSALTRKAQAAIEPQAWQDKVAAASAENPKAALAGSIASIPLGGFNPSVGNLVKAARAVPKLATGLSATHPEAVALRNVGFGTGLGAAQPVINYGIGLQPEAPTPQQILTEAATGALFSKPNAIGRRLGFGDPVDPSVMLPTREALMDVPIRRPEVMPQQQQLDLALDSPSQYMQAKPRVSKKAAAPKEELTDPTHLSVKEFIEVGRSKTDDATLKQEDADELHKILASKVDWSKMPEIKEILLSEKFDSLDPDAWQSLSDLYNSKVNAPKEQVAPKADIVPEVKSTAQKPAKAPTTSKQMEYKPLDESNLQPKFNEKITEEEQQGIKEIWNEIDSGNHRAALNRIEYVYRNTDKPDLQSVLRMQMHLLKNKYKIEPSDQFRVDNPDVRYQEASELGAKTAEQLDAEGVPTDNLSKWHEMLSKWGKSMRGVKASEDAGLKNAKGEPISGRAYLRNSLRDAFVKINPDKAGPDTMPHELFHVFFDDLRNSGNKADAKLVKQVEEFVSKLPEYQEAHAKGHQWAESPEEFITSRQGLEFVRKQLQLDAPESGFRKWYKDLTAHLKTKFTKTATQEDYNRLLNYRFVNDPAFQSDRFRGSDTTELEQKRSEVREAGGRTPTAPNKNRPPESPEQQEYNKAVTDFESEGGKVVRRDAAFDKYKQQRDQEDSAMRLYKQEGKGKGLDINRVALAQEAGKADVEGKPELANKLQDLSDDLGDVDTATRNQDDSFIKSVFKDLPPVVEGERIVLIKDREGKVYPATFKDEYYEHPARGKVASIGRLITKNDGTKAWSHGMLAADETIVKGEETQSFREQEDSELRKQPGEGKTPYPFKMKELEKGREAVNEQYKKGEEAMDELFGEGNEPQSFLDSIKLAKHPKFRKAAHMQGIDMPEENIRNQSFSPLRSEVTRVRELDHPDAKKVADAFQSWRDINRHYVGELVNDATGQLLEHINHLNPKELFSLDNEKMQHVVDYLFDMHDKGSSSIKLSADEQKIADIVKSNLAKSEAAKLTYPDLAAKVGSHPRYIPMMIDRKAMNVLMNKAGSAEHTKLLQDWYKYYTTTLGKSMKEARDTLQSLKEGLGSRVTKNMSSKFAAIDKDAALQLPPSWRERNLIDLMSRFNNRFARRLAYHESIETNATVMKALEDPIEGIENQKNVKNITDDIAGIRDFAEDKRTAALGLIRSGMLGPITGAKDFVSNLTLGFQHQDIGQALLSPIAAWKDLSKNIAESFKAGVNRHNISSFELGDGGIDDITSLVRRTGDILNVVQGRNYLERISRATAFGQGKFLALDNIAKAHNNALSSQGKKFLDDFVPNWSSYVSTGKLPADILQEAAAKYVESVQGTYDFSGLPAVAMKGTFAPYLMLARWNIEKFNNFVKYNIEPLKQGNITPLLMSTLGMFLGGEAVNQLVEVATGRKERTPKFQELKQIAKDKDGNISLAAAYKLAGLASLAGYTGMMGDVVKSLLDVQFKNRPQAYDNPLISGLETGVQDIEFVVEALQKGDLDLTADAIGMVLEDYLQGYRLAIAQLSGDKKQDIERKNKLRDLKLYKTTHGKDVGDVISDRANPLIDKDVKEFKRAEPKEAAKQLPILLRKAIKQSKGNPELLRRELAKLKAHSYQTMPNPNNFPRTFLSYLSYLRDTQGSKAAAERLHDYVMTNAEDKVKSAMVPDI